MIGQALSLGNGNPSETRVFIYEVEGLQQNEETNKNSYAIRNSSTISFRVPYNRMNQEMQKITRLGGKIVNIRPFSLESESKEESEE